MNETPGQLQLNSQVGHEVVASYLLSAVRLHVLKCVFFRLRHIESRRGENDEK